MLQVDISSLSFSSPIVLYGGLALLAISYVISSFITWYRLRHIPGPFLASFSYLWIVKNAILGTIGEEHEKLSRYGRLVRTGPHYVVTDDPDVLRQTSAIRGTYARDEWWHGLRTNPDADTMATILDPKTHDAYKAKAIHGYNGRGNNLEQAVDEQILRLIRHIRTRHLSTPEKTNLVDWAPLSRYFALDVVTRVTYGQDFGFLSDTESDPWGVTDSIDRMASFAVLSDDIPWVRRLVASPLGRRFVPQPTDSKGLGRFIGIGQGIARDRYAAGKTEEKDVIGGFMRHGMTSQEAQNETILILFAGSDTTATAIRGTMLFLISTPRAYQRLKTIIKDAVSSDSVGSPITLAQAKAIPYLQAVIYEGFRMRGPVTYGHYKKVPPGGDTFNGVYLPAGTAIGHNTVAMMRRRDIFGEDVEIFRPERWLECDEERRMDMERTIDIVFGGGRWTCAGKPIAWLELNKIFFEVLRYFDVQLANPAKGWEERSGLIWMHRNMLVRITEAE